MQLTNTPQPHYKTIQLNTISTSNNYRSKKKKKKKKSFLSNLQTHRLCIIIIIEMRCYQIRVWPAALVQSVYISINCNKFFVFSV